MTRRLRVAIPGVVVVLVALGVRKLRGGPVPAWQGSTGAGTGASTRADGGGPGGATAPPAGASAPPELVTDLPGLLTDLREPVVPTEPAGAPAPTMLAPEAVNARHRERIWVAPAADGTCPLSHPVKAKTVSGIYHLPGGVSYARTRPDRCYRSAPDADADGLRPAKR